MMRGGDMGFYPRDLALFLKTVYSSVQVAPSRRGEGPNDLHVPGDRADMERIAYGVDRAARAGSARARAPGRSRGALPLSGPPAAAPGVAGRAAPDRPLGQRAGAEPLPPPH